jgi:hypothetical protein
MAIGPDPRDAMASHLLEAIERVRADVAKVEFWASAMIGFSQPVPVYDSAKSNVWLPREQAHRLQDHEFQGKKN